jgi:hypothetical protein
VVRRPEILLVLVGVPLVAAIVAVADRKGSFRLDTFPTPLRKQLALALLGVVLCATVLLPALSAGDVDPSTLRFAQVFSGRRSSRCSSRRGGSSRAARRSRTSSR